MDMNSFASFAAQEHELFLNALNGRYLQMLTPGSKPTPKDVVDFTKWANGVRDALRVRMSESAAELVSTLEAGADHATTAQMRALLVGYQDALARITLENVETVIQSLRIGRDDLGKVFTSPMGGAMGSLLIKKLQKLDFKSKDTADRKWDSNRFLSFIAREFVYRLKLAKQLGDIGSGLAEVFWPDHESDGVVFAPKGNFNTYPSFADLEKTVFHPNSTAEVRPHAAP